MEMEDGCCFQMSFQWCVLNNWTSPRSEGGREAVSHHYPEFWVTKDINRKFWEELITYFPWYDTDCI
jgi:hypothetical protein